MSAQPDNKNDQSPNNQQTTPTETTTISTETQPHPTLQVSKVNHSNDELEEALYNSTKNLDKYLLLMNN